jgi:hypothetical protein
MMDKYVLFDKTLLEVKNQIEKTAEVKMKSVGINTELVKQKAIRNS